MAWAQGAPGGGLSHLSIQSAGSVPSPPRTNGETNNTDAKMPGNAAHHRWVPLGDPRPPGPVLYVPHQLWCAPSFMCSTLCVEHSRRRRSSTREQRDNCPTLTYQQYSSPAAWKKQCAQFIFKSSNQRMHAEVPIDTLISPFWQPPPPFVGVGVNRRDHRRDNMLLYTSLAAHPPQVAHPAQKLPLLLDLCLKIRSWGTFCHPKKRCC